MINIFGWTILRTLEIENIKQQAIEADANEFGMRLEKEALEGRKNSLEVDKIYVDHINELQNKLGNLELGCRDYLSGQEMYEEMIEKQRRKIKKLEAKIIKLKENQ